jgi:hypothetical protein
MATTHYIPSPEPVDRERGCAILDRQARRYLGISGEEFIAAWRAGEFAGPESDRPEVVRVASLLPLVYQ